MHILLQNLRYYKFLQFCFKSQLPQKMVRILCVKLTWWLTQKLLICHWVYWAYLRDLEHCLKLFETETPTTSCTLCNSFAGQFNVLSVTETWSCALVVPADCVTLPDCTEITHFSLPAVPEVTAKVSGEQKWCFVIQHLDSDQLINLGQNVMTKHGTAESHTYRDVFRRNRQSYA